MDVDSWHINLCVEDFTVYKVLCTEFLLLLQHDFSARAEFYKAMHDVTCDDESLREAGKQKIHKLHELAHSIVNVTN